MSGVAITFTVVAVMVVLFVWHRIPVAAVALSGTLVLYGLGVLELDEAIAGFGDPTVLFIAALFVVSASLDASGVTAWAGQLLARSAGASRRRLLVLTMLMVAALTALIGTGGAVAALLPVVVLLAVRLGHPPSGLLLPLAFAAHAGSMLVLTGSLVNVILSDAAVDVGLAPFGFFELTVVAVPLLAGTVAVAVLLGRRLVPQRSSRMIPADLSRHPGTLAEQYRLFEDVIRVEVPQASPFVGRRRTTLDLAAYDGVSIVGVQAGRAAGLSRRPMLSAGDFLILRGPAEAVARLARDQGLRACAEPTPAADVGATLFNATEGLAEVVIPPRSRFIGEAVFPGMTAADGTIVILAIQPRGAAAGKGETVLAAGDTLLLQGSWEALAEIEHDPDVLVVDRPELVRRQAVALGTGARRALVVLAVLVVLLATGLVSRAVAGLGAACAIVLLGVLTVEQAMRAVNGAVIVMIASLMPLATAMYKTGAAKVVATALVAVAGDAGSHALLALLFLLTATFCQLISSTATALIVAPIAISVALEVGISPRTALVTVAVAAAASFLTPIAGSANLMVQGPGGFRFTDYWPLGLPLLLWFFLVGVLLVPVLWQP